jgi:hypothetical protein
VSFTNLDQGSIMIIFESILPTFEAVGEVTKIGLGLKLNYHGQIEFA